MGILNPNTPLVLLSSDSTSPHCYYVPRILQSYHRSAPVWQQGVNRVWTFGFAKKFIGGGIMAIDGMNRRQFLMQTGSFGAAALLAGSVFGEQQGRNREQGGGQRQGRGRRLPSSTPNARRLGWNMAVQMYTFRDRSFYETLPVLEQLGIRGVEPAFFLPLSKENPELKTSEALSADARAEMKKRLNDHGVRMVSYYAALDANTEASRKIFDFCKEMGVRVIVSEPPIEALDKIEPLCDEYEIDLAIHNHAKATGSIYWDPEILLTACKDRSKRIGGCPDTGHYVRTGLDPVECLKKLKGRIIEVHLKDVIESGKVEARDVPLGTGKANYTAVLNELREQKWRGITTIEYEHLSDQLVQDVAQCAKFVEDYATSVRPQGETRTRSRTR